MWSSFKKKTILPFLLINRIVPQGVSTTILKGSILKVDNASELLLGKRTGIFLL